MPTTSPAQTRPDDDARAADLAEPTTEAPAEDTPDPVVDDLLVEDVSIDGMCGVY